jgi:hypothetical protein
MLAAARSESEKILKLIREVLQNPPATVHANRSSFGCLKLVETLDFFTRDWAVLAGFLITHREGM